MTRPAPDLPANPASNTLKECPRCYESVVSVSTSTRTRAQSLLTFTFAAQTANANSGLILSLWPGIVAFRQMS